MAYWSSITDCSYKPCVPHQQPRLTTQKGKKKKKRKQQIKRNGYCSKMICLEKPNIHFWNLVYFS